MYEPIALSMVERLYARNLYVCVRVDGEDADGTPRYAYFGIFLEDLQRLLRHLQTHSSANPKDFHGTVLARASGQPSEEIRDFMRTKFSFADETRSQPAILEISRKSGTAANQSAS